MSAITNINNTISSAVFLPNRGRLQQVQNTEIQIARIDREIDAREKYIASNNEVISITKELIDLHKQQRQTLIESRDLDRKRIALMERQIDAMKESKELDLKRINILEDRNNKLQNVLDDRNNKLRSLFNQGSGRSKSAEPRLNAKTSELNKLDEEPIVLAKKDAVLKEQSKAKDVLLEKQTMKLEHIEKQVARLESKVNGVVDSSVVQSKAKSADVNLSKVNTSTTNSKKDVSQAPVTYKPSVVAQAKTYSNDEVVPNTKTGLTINALHQQVRASQQNIYNSITNNLISSKFSKML